MVAELDLEAVVEVDEVVVLAADDDGGASDSDSDLDAATMMGGVDSNADEKSPDRLRNRLIVEQRAHRASMTWRALSYRAHQSISASRERDNARNACLPRLARANFRQNVYSTGTGDETNGAGRESICTIR